MLRIGTITEMRWRRKVTLSPVRVPNTPPRKLPQAFESIRWRIGGSGVPKTDDCGKDCCDLESLQSSPIQVGGSGPRTHRAAEKEMAVLSARASPRRLIYMIHSHLPTSEAKCTEIPVSVFPSVAH